MISSLSNIRQPLSSPSNQQVMGAGVTQRLSVQRLHDTDCEQASESTRQKLQCKDCEEKD